MSSNQGEAPSMVWLVTGASRGLGRAYVEAALGVGDRVVATARRPELLAELCRAHPEQLRVLPLDVSKREAVFSTVARALEAFGGLDVVVNNAGYGLVGAAEEVSEADVRAIMDTNFLGALWVTQAVLPHFRQRRAGHVVQMSSVGGVGTMPFFSMYNASKWALEAFSEALAREVEPWGIRVTVVEAGGFATDWARGSMRFAKPMEAYNGVRTSVLGTPDVPWDVNAPADPSEGRPEDAAAAVLAHVKAARGPLRLLVGGDAPVHVRMALEMRRDDYRKNPGFSWPSD